jgi:hypothetical protein
MIGYENLAILEDLEPQLIKVFQIALDSLLGLSDPPGARNQVPLQIFLDLSCGLVSFVFQDPRDKDGKAVLFEPKLNPHTGSQAQVILKKQLEQIGRLTKGLKYFRARYILK